MAEGGFDERTPFMEHTDEKGGGDDDVSPPGGNVSMGFNPGDPEAHSSPHSQRQTRLNTHDEIPSFFEPPNPPGLSTTFTAENELYKEFPFAEKYKLKFKMENAG